MEVYKSIAAIIGEMSEQGIKKSGKNKQQGWSFRGIDAVYNALAPLLAKHELMILPRIKNRTVSQQTSKNGGILFYVTVDAEFDFVSAKDGSKHTVCTIGEAMDSGDKATNKAMSIALKYAAFQSFFIPTDETTQDPDSQSHQVVDDEKPWYNEPDFQADYPAMKQAIADGQTHDDIIKQLSEGFKLSKTMREQLRTI